MSARRDGVTTTSQPFRCATRTDREERLTAQATENKPYPLDEQGRRNLTIHTVNRSDKVVAVSVPDDVGTMEPTEGIPATETRESIRMQALIVSVGAKMGMQIWIPRSYKAAVVREWAGDATGLLDRLPLNYDDTTLRTTEQIDVLWLKGRSIVRAFEVEHTTSVYSGILRMADLAALQPNMNIKLHIVAPEIRRDKVFQEIRRPVFLFSKRDLLPSIAPICRMTAFASWRWKSTFRTFRIRCSTHTSKRLSNSQAASAAVVARMHLCYAVGPRDEGLSGSNRAGT